MRGRCGRQAGTLTSGESLGRKPGEGRVAAARLTHAAICVSALERAAKFCENVFDIKRVGDESFGTGSAVYMSDGVMNLALLNFKSDRTAGIEDRKNFVGTHHFGIQVDGLAEAQRLIGENGGTFHFDFGTKE